MRNSQHIYPPNENNVLEGKTSCHGVLTLLKLAAVVLAMMMLWGCISSTPSTFPEIQLPTPSQSTPSTPSPSGSQPSSPGGAPSLPQPSGSQPPSGSPSVPSLPQPSIPQPTPGTGDGSDAPVVPPTPGSEGDPNGEEGSENQPGDPQTTPGTGTEPDDSIIPPMPNQVPGSDGDPSDDQGTDSEQMPGSEPSSGGPQTTGGEILDMPGGPGGLEKGDPKEGVDQDGTSDTQGGLIGQKPSDRIIPGLEEVDMNGGWVVSNQLPKPGGNQRDDGQSQVDAQSDVGASGAGEEVGVIQQVLQEMDGAIADERNEGISRANDQAGDGMGEIDTVDPGEGDTPEDEPGVGSSDIEDEAGVVGSTPNLPPTRDTQDLDHPDAKDDDVVARQMREAAIAETDPELKEKLWEEYETYREGL